MWDWLCCPLVRNGVEDDAQVNREWATEQLDAFLRLTELYRPPDPPHVVNLTAHMSTRGAQHEIVASAQVVEQILDRVLPGWRTEVPADRNKSVNRWYQHREAAERARAALAREDEVRRNLGDDAPRLSASRLHPWIWDGARALWQSDHYREAVGAAARKLNAETQNKLDRRDVSETDLFKQAFSLDAPKPGARRLRVLTDDGSKTYQSMHRGVMAYAEGCFAAIRNPVAHSEGELSEDKGLEQLAALSVLARWVDGAQVLPQLIPSPRALQTRSVLDEVDDATRVSLQGSLHPSMRPLSSSSSTTITALAMKSLREVLRAHLLPATSDRVGLYNPFNEGITSCRVTA